MLSSNSSLHDQVKALKIVDMTHTFSPDCPTWTGEIGITLKLNPEWLVGEKYSIRTYNLEMVQNIGTHIDAPSHLIDNGVTVSQLALNNLVNIPLCVINIADKGQKDPDYELTVEDILDYEAKYNEKVPSGSLVVCYTGWDQFWPDKVKYRGLGEDGRMHFPVFSLEAVKFLEENRGIAGIGIDNMSPEIELDLPLHHYILGRGKYIVENLANVSKMPEYGGTVSVMPMKADVISEAPARVVGFYSE